MSNENEPRDDLLKRTEEAWAAFCYQTYEVIAPRFYKEKRARKMELISPWKNMAERNEAEAKQFKLYQAWLPLFQQCVKELGIRPPLPELYLKRETPNGDRYVKAL